MSSDAAAYRALGLGPGADAASVEAAYRKLIKRYHPDRKGGDPARAAEINWAYHHIRKARRLPETRRTSYPVVQQECDPDTPSSGRPWAGVALAAVALLLLVNAGSVERWWAGASTRELPGRSEPFVPPDISEAPLDSDAIDRSVLSALRLARGGGLDRLAGQSRHCHAELRRRPDLSRLDQCVAFDEAVVVLVNAGAADDRGPFSAGAVTGRQIGAARLFSNDYLTMESRLDRIRARVEFTLAPADPPPAPRRR